MMRRLAVALLSCLALPALAQQAPPQPSETTEKFGAWTVRCVQQAESAERACEVLLAIQGQGGLIAQIAVGRPQGGEGTLVVARTPLGVLLSDPVTVAPAEDEAAAVALPFVTCLANGCLAQALIAGDRLGALVSKEMATVGFAERSGRKIQISVPLAGLRDALTRIGLDCGSGVCAASE